MNSKDKDKNKSVSNVNPYSTYIKDSTIGEDAHHNLNKNTKSTKKQNHKSPGSETCLNLPATKGSLEENPYESYRNGEKTTIPEENNSVDNRKQDAKKLSEMTYSNKFGRTIKEIEAKRPTKAEPVPITSGVEEQLTKKDIASNSVDKQENVDDIPEADIKKPEPEIDLNFVNHESELFKSKSGGIYLPPAKLKQYQQDITDKNSEMYQRLHWVAIKKTINGLMNKINADNIINVIHELLEENVIRCRGLLVRSLIINQDYSPMYSNIYAALVSVINTKLPQIGELLLKRLVMNFKLYYGGNMRQECINSVRFIAHLTNQFVCDELLVLEILFTLLDEPTTISIEVACGFLRECGQFLDTNCARASNAIYERLRTLLYEADIPKRSQYMIEVLFAIRRDKYKDYPSVIQELQLIDEEDQYTHKILLEEDYDPEKRLNIFKYDPDFVINESKYQEIRREVLGDSESSDEEEEFSDDDDAASGAGSFSSEHDENEIQDNTDANMIAMRRTIYLTVNSSLDCDECVHKIMKLNIKPTQFSLPECLSTAVLSFGAMRNSLASFVNEFVC
ncbi:MAG: pre-mRNA-splicing factor cwc22, variant 2 [Marteilia pararefringens]